MKHSFSSVGFTMSRRDSFVFVKPLGDSYLAPAARPRMVHRTVLLDSLWITPAKRGTGHGRKVLDDALAFTDLLALDVILEVNSYDTARDRGAGLVKLYESAGFKVLRGRREWPRPVMRRVYSEAIV